MNRTEPSQAGSIDSDFRPIPEATVTIPLQADPLPIRDPGDGSLRIGSSRVLLELVLHAFQDGERPESIVDSYDTLELADVYAVIAHYLRHPEPFDAYLETLEVEAEQVKAKLEAIGAWRTIESRSEDTSQDSEQVADARSGR